MASFFDRIKTGLSKTAQQIRERLSDVAEARGPAPAAAPGTQKSGRAVALDTLDAIEDALIAADVGLPATQKIVDAVRNERDGAAGERVRQVMRGILQDVEV